MPIQVCLCTLFYKAIERKGEKNDVVCYLFFLLTKSVYILLVYLMTEFNYIL